MSYVHRWFRTSVLVVLMLLVCSFTVASRSVLSARQHPTAGAQLITNTLVGSLVGAGDYVFWVDMRDNSTALYGYNLRTQQEFRIQELQHPSDAYDLASDGQTLAWIDTTQFPQRIQAYDLMTQQIFTVITDTEVSGLDSIALDNGILYYADTTLNHQGIYAYNLTARQEQQLTPVGLDPVVQDGVLLWQEIHRPAGSVVREQHLYMRKLSGILTDTLVVSSTGDFSGYAVAGEHVVWSLYPGTGDERVYSYASDTGNTVPLSVEAGHAPVSAQSKVAWRHTAVARTSSITRTLAVYDYTTRQTVPLIAQSTAIILEHTFVTPDIMAFALQRDPRSSTNELYIASVGQPGLQFSTVDSSGPEVAQAHQVRVCGQRLCAGPNDTDLWSPNGVQFFLPAQGINSKSFCNNVYPGAAAEREFWLNQAQMPLFARTLRIYAYAPGGGDCGQPIAPATLLDFAQLADNRGMRIGLVIHNVGIGFTFEDAQRNWLRDVHNAFASTEINGKPALSVLAYINVSNEINKYCAGNGDYDCFVQGEPGYNPIVYINDAVAWVREVTNFIRNDLQSPVLLTVGMSTEMDRRDERTGAVNFFQLDSQQNRLAQYVDFLSPHSYGGGAKKIMDEIRIRNKNIPVLLEEYGYATDPLREPPPHTAPRANTYRESLSNVDCGINPIQQPDHCLNTAPFFIQSNILAMQTEGYSGGVAFMITDTQARDCDAESDHYTGLLTESNDKYCAGTITRGRGSIKSTGRIVRTFHAPFIIFLPLAGRG